MLRIKNLTRDVLHVGVRHPDNKLDSVQVMPRTKGVELRDGLIVDPRWLQQNPDVLKVSEV